MKQKSYKLGKETGSFVNWVMSCNQTTPTIGMGATELHWTDRSPWHVIDVDKDGKGCTIQAMDVKATPDASKIGMGHQCWELTPYVYGATRHLRWRYNSWQYKTQRYYLTDLYWEDRQNARNTMDDAEFSTWLDTYKKENAEMYPQYFEHHTEWHKMKIVFGRAEYHYDWEF